MDYTDEDVLRDALQNQDLQRAKRCIRAGQNPMQLMNANGLFTRIPFYAIHTAGKELHPEFLSLLALRNLIDLNEINHSSIHNASLLFYTLMLGRTKKVHLLLQAGVDVNAPFTTHPRRRDQSIFTAVNLSKECALMLLFADGNPKEGIFPVRAVPQARIWLSGLLQAKQCFKEIFDDVDLEALLSSFIFHQVYLQNACG